jgi:hypothetical protein
MQQSSTSPSLPAGELISLDEARTRTGHFREHFMQRHPEVPETVKANAFSKDILMRILDQPGCEGIRMYHSVRPSGEAGSVTLVRELVLIGIDREGNDMLEVAAGPGDGKHKKGCNPLGIFLALPASPPPVTPGAIAANPRPCPHMCGNQSPLG